MSVSVKCGQCGKEFRAKDYLAGKTVRCPGCQQPLRIPGSPAGAGPSAAPTPPPPAAKSPDDVDRAVLRLEQTRRKKVLDAETDAAQHQEMKKLAEAWDQLSGKAGKPGEPAERIGAKATKVTAVTKAQDRFGMLRSTLVWKYVALLVLLVAAGWGSSRFIRSVMTTTAQSTAYQAKSEADIRQLFKEADEALKQKRWGRCRECLEEIVRIQPHRVNNIEYKRIKAELQKAAGG